MICIFLSVSSLIDKSNNEIRDFFNDGQPQSPWLLTITSGGIEPLYSQTANANVLSGASLRFAEGIVDPVVLLS